MSDSNDDLIAWEKDGVVYVDHPGRRRNIT